MPDPDAQQPSRALEDRAANLLNTTMFAVLGCLFTGLMIWVAADRLSSALALFAAGRGDELGWSDLLSVIGSVGSAAGLTFLGGRYAWRRLRR